MKITITGESGAGKSTAAKLLAKKLHYKHYSIGGLMRELAVQRKVDFLKLHSLRDSDPEIDKYLDNRQKRLGEDEDDFVLDSRLGFLFITDSIKIYLDVDRKVGAQRVFSQHREDEKNDTPEKTLKNIRKRETANVKRFRKIYGVNFTDRKNYNMVIDTTRLDADRVVKRIMNFLKRSKK